MTTVYYKYNNQIYNNNKRLSHFNSRSNLVNVTCSSAYKKKPIIEVAYFLSDGFTRHQIVPLAGES